MSKKSRNYKDLLVENLRDKKECVSYLNEALEESFKWDEDSGRLFLVALRNVVIAQGGFINLSKKSNLGRESLYKALSEKGNPKWNTIVSICKSIGFNIVLELKVINYESAYK